MNYQQALDYLHSFERFGWDLGLDRLAVLLQNLGNPQEKLRCIHVAGTNGKGSVCTMTANILKGAGYKTGLYTSPFVVDFRERFQINGEMIEKQTLADYTARLKTAIEAVEATGIHVTEFEVITALAFLWFYEQGCAVVVLEVGLGGRFDATNVITQPLLAAITSISEDHIAILGDSLEKIAYEKAGIIKQNSTVCVWPSMHPDALGVLLSVVAETGSRLIQASRGSVTVNRCDDRGSDICYNGVDYSLSLVGAHQIDNALLVLSMVTELRQKGFALPDEVVQQALQDTHFAARFEVLSTDPYIVVDGAHNVEGVTGLAHTLDGIDRPKVVLMGMLADKDYGQAVSVIASRATHFFALPVDSPRALEKEKTAEAAAAVCPQVHCLADGKVSLTTALSLLPPNGMLVVCGSLFVASTMRPLILDHLA